MFGQSKVVLRYPELGEQGDAIPSILNAAIQRLRRTGEIEKLESVAIADQTTQKQWIEKACTSDAEEWILGIILSKQFNPVSINSNVFSLLNLPEDLQSAICTLIIFWRNLNMGYGGCSIHLRPQAGRRKPSQRELKPIHDYFHQLFARFCQRHLNAAAWDYFRKVTIYDEALRLEQQEETLDEQKVWSLTWWVYSHQDYTAFEHWLPIFLAHSAQTSGDFGLKAQQKKFEVIPYPLNLQNLLLVKPEFYQYITLTRGFYLLHTSDEIWGLQAASGVAPEDFAPKQNDFIPFQFFAPEEQRLMQTTRLSEVCQCPICASLRTELNL